MQPRPCHGLGGESEQTTHSADTSVAGPRVDYPPSSVVQHVGELPDLLELLEQREVIRSPSTIGQGPHVMKSVFENRRYESSVDLPSGEDVAIPRGAGPYYRDPGEIRVVFVWG